MPIPEPQVALHDTNDREPTDGYQPPRVEAVLSAEELERESLYAGGQST